MSLFPFNRQSVFLTPTPLFFALTGKRCRKLLMESTRDSGDLGAGDPGGARSPFGSYDHRLAVDSLASRSQLQHFGHGLFGFDGNQVASATFDFHFAFGERPLADAHSDGKTHEVGVLELDAGTLV